MQTIIERPGNGAHTATPTASAAVPTSEGFDFLRRNIRQDKPRTRGITEIRGAYYSPIGKRELSDILETMGNYVDALKFAGGSFTLMPFQELVELNELCHKHDVLVSTGGFMERVLTQGNEAVGAMQHG
jgi:phosphosulfolactate synthase (CoM biosynthesis protein A)